MTNNTQDLGNSNVLGMNQATSSESHDVLMGITRNIRGTSGASGLPDNVQTLTMYKVSQSQAQSTGSPKEYSMSMQQQTANAMTGGGNLEAGTFQNMVNHQKQLQ